VMNFVEVLGLKRRGSTGGGMRDENAGFPYCHAPSWRPHDAKTIPSPVSDQALIDGSVG
jgi:hypothetical protein